LILCLFIVFIISFGIKIAAESDVKDVVDNVVDNIETVDNSQSDNNAKDNLNSRNENKNTNEEEIADANESIDEGIDENENSNESRNETSLENSVFLGDSITEALSYYKFVNRSRVIADKGYTAKKAISAIDKVVSLNPDKIFIMFGLNDMLTERSVDGFIKNYTSLIRQLKERLPNADIYIQSILPVASKAESSKLALSNSQIEKFNEGLKNLAQQENVYYLDVASIPKKYGDLHEPDGIHYKSKFCTLWLEYIVNNI